MGLFDKIDKGFKDLGKSIKKEAKKAEKKLNKAGFNKNFGRDFQKGFAMTGRALQEPEKFIARNDPIGKKMGGASFLSPIQLGTGIITAPLSSIGYFEELAGDPKLQKKLRQGDTDTIINTSLAPLGLIPLGIGGSAEKNVAKGVAEGGLKQTTKQVSKQVGKKLGTGAVKKTFKQGVRQSAKGITKGAFNPATMKGFKSIKEIPKQPFVKQTLSKAARLKNAKAALKKSGQVGKSIKQLF